MSVITITKSNFQSEVIQSSKPVLVDFWAPWCGPCRMITPIIEEVAGEQDSVKVAKVNVDDYNELAVSYGIMNIPTLILFKDGKPVAKAMGMQSKEAILNLISK